MAGAGGGERNLESQKASSRILHTYILPDYIVLTSPHGEFITWYGTFQVQLIVCRHTHGVPELT